MSLHRALFSLLLGLTVALALSALVVPAGHYMMLGDNRYQSKDSRYWGLVPRENVRGRPLFIYFSIDWPRKDIRWSRIGDWVR